MNRALPLIALAALASASGAAEEAVLREPLVAQDLTWTLQDSARPRSVAIRTGDGRSNVSVPVDRLEQSEGLAPGARGEVRFSLPREAGLTDCTGSHKRSGAAGTCRFVSAPAFEQELAQRGVELGQRRNLIPLALVDARLALVDAFSREGMPLSEASDLIAASALDITGDYIHELKSAGLQLKRLRDVFACRAVGVEGAFVRDMADAGYPKLTAQQAITMKAVGVTPQYAIAMNRALGAVRAVESAGELQ